METQPARQSYPELIEKLRRSGLALNGGYEYRDRIGREWDGVKVLDYLAGRYAHSSRDRWRERIENGEISLDGLKASPNVILKQGQQISWHRPPWEEPNAPLAFAVLHEDEDVLAVAKPSGLPTLPGGGFLDHTLLALVRRPYPEAVPIHRLGRGTSGVVLFARTQEARSILCEAMRRKEMGKVYRALATGIPPDEHFVIRARIGPMPHPLLGTIHAVNPGGKQAVTLFRVLSRRADTSVVEARIETGRPHQIRIHLAAAGHPLAGDPVYAPGGGIKEPARALPGDCGYLLHAQCIRFRHPRTGEPVEVFCSPPPPLSIDGG